MLSMEALKHVEGLIQRQLYPDGQVGVVKTRTANGRSFGACFPARHSKVSRLDADDYRTMFLFFPRSFRRL